MMDTRGVAEAYVSVDCRYRDEVGLRESASRSPAGESTFFHELLSGIDCVVEHPIIKAGEIERERVEAD